MSFVLHTSRLIVLLAVVCGWRSAYSQPSSFEPPVKKVVSQIYVDNQGVLRWSNNQSEASFFGVNYTTPFAYAYRAHKALGVDIEKAIQQDVYHLARLGLDAFRVHVWDTEISDVNGNLLENDHLKLYDFLLAELKKRNIKAIVTPIAFWGNGYPENDEDTPGFSHFFGRGKLTTNDSAIAAQENYLKQFLQHVNPYTRLSYRDDPDIIAAEINNEPSHSGPKDGVTAYINRLTTAIKSTGWSKPVFYNISQGPWYADAVARSSADGFSFQWYPSGLVSGHMLKGNYLPNVDHYKIPFDSIAGFKNRALMVYEFDAADILQSCMYPAMARSFREAGFQWATQFAYDPLALAHANTEYMTHYLNLAYTPSKAISLLIASKVFHRIPLRTSYGSYPVDCSFDTFRVSYEESLSEMNSEREYYYSNSTQTKPVNANLLTHVAGVGNSPIVQHNGSGAYFLDQLAEGVWRLEVMPNAICIRDPFERPSPTREVTRVQWDINHMQISIPGLGTDFSVRGLNEGNSRVTQSGPDGFDIGPGTYLLQKKGSQYNRSDQMTGVIGLREFVAPKPISKDWYVCHEPYSEVTQGKTFAIRCQAVGLDTGRAELQISRKGTPFRSIAMTRLSAYEFSADVPADMVTPGQLNYRIVLKAGNTIVVFPGNHKGNPSAWDNYQTDTWRTLVADKDGGMELFNASADLTPKIYPTYRRGVQTSYITSTKPGQLIWRMTAADLTDISVMGFQYSFGDKVKGRQSEAGSFDKLVVRARTGRPEEVMAKVVLTSSDATSVSCTIALTENFHDIEIPLNRFKGDSGLLMPRPFPGFQPLAFNRPSTNSGLRVGEIEKLEITIGSGMAASELSKPHGLDVECVWLEKSK